HVDADGVPRRIAGGEVDLDAAARVARDVVEKVGLRQRAVDRHIHFDAVGARAGRIERDGEQQRLRPAGPPRLAAGEQDERGQEGPQLPTPTPELADGSRGGLSAKARPTPAAMTRAPPQTASQKSGFFTSGRGAGSLSTSGDKLTLAFAFTFTFTF